MLLAIRDFRKIKSADIDLGKITLIAGMNNQGKTCITQALSALLTGNASVLASKKKDAKSLVRDGAEKAVVQLSEGDNIASITWPDMEISNKGFPRKATLEATGQVRFTSLPPKEAADSLINLLKASPTKEQVMPLLLEHVSQENAEKIWKIIETDGWDSVVAMFEKQIREVKAEWRAVTGEEWGSSKALSWMPAGVPQDVVLNGNQAILETCVIEAKKRLEDAIGSAAVDGQKIAQMKARVDKIPELIKQRDEIKSAILSIETRIKEIDDALSNLPPLSDVGNFPCPHCSGMIAIEGIKSGISKYVKAEQVDVAKREAARKENAELYGEKANLSGKLGGLQRSLNDVIAQGKGAVAAKNELAEMGEPGATPAVLDVDAARTAFADAERNLLGFLKYHDARDKHKRIEAGQGALKICQPDGIRKQMMADKLAEFHTTTLLPLCEQMGLVPFVIGEDMTIRQQGHTYKLLAESVKFRVDCVMQMAYAKLDGSEMVVIDGADIIVGPDRGKLLGMLAKNDIPALLTVSMPNQDKLPNLSSVGGYVYWVSDGSVNLIS